MAVCARSDWMKILVSKTCPFLTLGGTPSVREELTPGEQKRKRPSTPPGGRRNYSPASASTSAITITPRRDRAVHRRHLLTWTSVFQESQTTQASATGRSNR